MKVVSRSTKALGLCGDSASEAEITEKPCQSRPCAKLVVTLGVAWKLDSTVSPWVLLVIQMRTLFLGFGVALFLIIGGPALFADDQETQESVTVIYYPSGGATNGITKSLGRLLGNDIVPVELVEQNMLLIRVPVDQQERVTKLIKAIDMPRPMIRYQLVWLYTNDKLTPDQLKTLQGPKQDVRSAISKLDKDGLVLRKSEFETTSLSNTECSMTKSDRESVVVGTVHQPRGQAIKRTEYQEYGTTVQMRGLATKANILVDLNIERSVPQKANDVGPGEQTALFQSTIQIGDGDATVVSSSQDESKAGTENLYLVFSAETE